MFYFRVVADEYGWRYQRGAHFIARYDTLIEALKSASLDAAGSAPSELLYHPRRRRRASAGTRHSTVLVARYSNGRIVSTAATSKVRSTDPLAPAMETETPSLCAHTMALIVVESMNVASERSTAICAVPDLRRRSRQAHNWPTLPTSNSPMSAMTGTGPARSSMRPCSSMCPLMGATVLSLVTVVALVRFVDGHETVGGRGRL